MAGEAEQIKRREILMIHRLYEDERGWRYRVFPGIGRNTYKARYLTPGMASWKCVARLPWRDSIEEAQEDLDQLAKKKGWRAV